MRSMRLFFLAALLLQSQSCKTPSKPHSRLDSSPGGEPKDWTCNELKTQYAVKHEELSHAIGRFLAEQDRLVAAGRIKATTKVPPAASVRLSDDGPSSMIGQGKEAPGPLPEPINSFRERNIDSIYSLKLAADCDDKFGAFGQSRDTQILEQCRLVVGLFNDATVIMNEYNNYRNGECRSGRAAMEAKQASIIYPYCVNPCRFGQTTCVKCAFTAGVASFYLCGEEQDARQAIDVHCREGGWECSGKTAQCDAPKIYNETAAGTTAAKESNTKIEVKANVSAKLEGEFSEGVEVKVHNETKLEVAIEGNIRLKNERGGAIITSHGGDTATTYSCDIGVSMGVVRSTGVEVGVGFDVVVAKGSAVAGVGTELSALTEYRTSSREIPAAGQPLVNMLEGCRRFALAWAANDLPGLITRNVVVKTVASKFMGNTSDKIRHNLGARKNIWCKTDRRQSYISGQPVQYRVDDTYWQLKDDKIEFSYSYSGTINPIGYNSPMFGFGSSQLGASRYAEARKMIFNGAFAENDDLVMRTIEAAYRYNGYVKECKVGKW